MSSPILDHILFYSTPETFPTTIADNDPVQHSLIPHYHVKHLRWYFDDADLFFKSNKGFGYDLGLCRCHTDGNAENTNDWFNTSIYSTTVSITNHHLDEILGRRNY